MGEKEVEESGEERRAVGFKDARRLRERKPGGHSESSAGKQEEDEEEEA